MPNRQYAMYTTPAREGKMYLNLLQHTRDLDFLQYTQEPQAIIQALEGKMYLDLLQHTRDLDFLQYTQEPQAIIQALEKAKCTWTCYNTLETWIFYNTLRNPKPSYKHLRRQNVLGLATTHSQEHPKQSALLGPSELIRHRALHGLGDIHNGTFLD